jgi:hypothetical protein
VNASTLETSALRTALPPLAASTWRLRSGTVLFLGLWLFLLVAGRERFFYDPGVFWHTVTGERMLAQGELVRHDPFTFTYENRHWIAHQWLGECLMAALYRLGGWDALLVATAALLAALLAWIGARLLRGGISPPATAFMLGIVFLAGAHHFHARPHLASMVGMGVTFALLCDVEMGRRKASSLVWLVPLFALWTNLHGGALGGLATATLIMTGWLLWAVLRLPSPLQTSTDRAWMATAWIGCLATIVLNPFGWQMPQTWMTIMQLSLPEMIDEHGRPNLLRVETWMLALSVAGYLALLATTLSLRPRLNFAGVIRAVMMTRVTWLVVLIWLALGCDRVRHVPLAVIATAIALPDVLAASGRKRWFVDRGWLATEANREANLDTHSPWWRAWRQPAMLVALVLVLSACGSGSVWARLDSTRWPIELVDDLHAIESHAGGEARIFNALDFGGFLTLYAPHLKTFIDDRCELFGDTFLRSYFEAETARPERLEAWRRQYGFEHALVRTGSPFDQYLGDQAGWQCIGRTPAGTLYHHIDAAK